MKTILHIGSEKTGSTSLQVTLLKNRTALAEQGIYVPRWSDPQLRTHTLYPLVFGMTDAEVAVFCNNNGGFSKIFEVAWNDWTRIEAEISEAKPHTLILSSELLFRVLGSQSNRFLKRLKGMSSEIEVVAYLRAPESFVISSLSQAFKHSRSTRLSVLAAKLDYTGVLASYRKDVSENLSIFDYARSRHEFGSVVQHFFETVLPCKLPADDEGMFENVTPSPEALVLLQDIFSDRYGTDHWAMSGDDYTLLNEAVRIDRSVPGGPSRLTPLAKRWLAEQDLKNDWLLEAFGIDFPTFSHTPLSQAELFTSDTVSLDDVLLRDLDRQTTLETVLVRAMMPKRVTLLERLKSRLGRVARTVVLKY